MFKIKKYSWKKIIMINTWVYKASYKVIIPIIRYAVNNFSFVISQIYIRIIVIVGGICKYLNKTAFIIHSECNDLLYINVLTAGDTHTSNDTNSHTYVVYCTTFHVICNLISINVYACTCLTKFLIPMTIILIYLLNSNREEKTRFIMQLIMQFV